MAVDSRRALTAALCATTISIGAVSATALPASAQSCADGDDTCVETEVLGKVQDREPGSRLVIGGGLIILGGAAIAGTRPNRKRPSVQA